MDSGTLPITYQRYQNKDLKFIIRDVTHKLKKTNIRIPGNLRITNNAVMDNTGEYVLVQGRGGKTQLKKYTLDKYFANNQFSASDTRKILERLNDYILVVKEVDGCLRAGDIASCENVEIRQFLLARFGFERFMRDIGGEVIHSDKDDKGFDRELIMFTWKNDSGSSEPLVFVKVRDSTNPKKIYLLRVPPDTKRCKEGVAWTFGIREEDYKPQKET